MKTVFRRKTACQQFTSKSTRILIRFYTVLLRWAQHQFEELSESFQKLAPGVSALTPNATLSPMAQLAAAGIMKIRQVLYEINYRLNCLEGVYNV